MSKSNICWNRRFESIDITYTFFANQGDQHRKAGPTNCQVSLRYVCVCVLSEDGFMLFFFNEFESV